MGSLGLQRSWGCHGKFGRPNCMRLVGREAVDRTAVFVCRPKDAANHTWGHRACARKACCVGALLRAVLLRAALLLAALLDEAVVALVAWSGFVDRVF